MKTILLSLAVPAAFALGSLFEHRLMVPEINAAMKIATDESNVAKAWEKRYEDVYPMVTQWRLGYEQLKARCELK